MVRPFPWGRLYDAILAQPYPVQMQLWFVACMLLMCGVMVVPFVGLVGWRGLRPVLVPFGLLLVGGSFLVRYLVVGA